MKEVNHGVPMHSLRLQPSATRTAVLVSCQYILTEQPSSCRPLLGLRSKSLYRLPILPNFGNTSYGRVYMQTVEQAFLL